MTRDPRVDAYIAQLQPFAQPILEYLREVIHRAVPEIEETIKWGVPTFTLGGKNLAGLAGFKQHAALVIHAEAEAGGGYGSFGKLASLDDLPPEKEIAARLNQARDANDPAKAKPRRKPNTGGKPPIAVPEDFSAALSAQAKAKATFEGFTDAQRRDYLEWITEAKRDETRAKRIATSVEWLAEGKRRNWKYENC